MNGTAYAGYIDTGTMIEWDGAKSFTYNGEKYMKLDIDLTYVFLYELCDLNDYTAEFNIKKEVV